MLLNNAIAQQQQYVTWIHNPSKMAALLTYVFFLFTPLSPTPASSILRLFESLKFRKYINPEISFIFIRPTCNWLSCKPVHGFILHPVLPLFVCSYRRGLQLQQVN